ncbi:unnamed protein product [Caenorhabditis bovis]|uniref:SOSS complex subunit A homolog n=1 Tax=Caenorhabditis bovis TaxID=2654633 RepID=A0A8S1F4M5_9PELO|nr:unnamed protein product [Caenorhabditis bovis]
MNEQEVRRMQKVAVCNLKMECPPDILKRFAIESLNFDNKLGNLSEKEAIDIMISKEEAERLSLGVVYNMVTSAENPEKFNKMIRYVVGAGPDFWHLVLCNMNMIILELWNVIHQHCKEQLIRLIGEAMRLNVKSIENVMLNVFRALNGLGDWPSKTRILSLAMSVMRDSEMWYKTVKSCAGLTMMILSTVAHVIADTPVPMTHTDTFRTQLINFFAWAIKIRKIECYTLGRDFLLVLSRVGRLPQIDEIWKELYTSPLLFGVGSIEDLLSKPNQLNNFRISTELQRKIEFLLCSANNKNIFTYFDWLRKYFRCPDNTSIRAEIIRYLCMTPLDGKPPCAYDNRTILIHLLITTGNPGADQQWLKFCVIFDWFSCDERYPIDKTQNVEILLSLVRYALSLPVAPNSASVGQAFANSLLEYLCKSVDLFIPPLAEPIRRNANYAMRICRDRFQHGLPQILEHFKIDRRVGDMLRSVFPDFMRQPNLKKKDGKEMMRRPEKQPERNVEPPTAHHHQHHEVEQHPPPKLTVAEMKRLQKEKEEKEEAELTSLIQLLKGDIKAKMEALKNEYKELSDDADKCEAVEVVLNAMFKIENKMDDAQQEIAAQCLLGIIGSVVVEDKSLLPEVVNEKQLEEAFTHPIYSILRTLCFPPSNEPTATEVMTNLMAAMREKDPTITYVFLYFIKGAVERPQTPLNCYREVARVIDKTVVEMICADLQLCAVNDSRLFSYLVPFVCDQFESEFIENPQILYVVCNNLDGNQLSTFIGQIIREEIRLFRKDSFINTLFASVEWPTTAQWVFWQLVQVDGVAIEWFVQIIPRLEASKHEEAISNVLLMMKHMDREPWPGLIRSIFSRTPARDDTFTIDALKVLIEDPEQRTKVSELVGALIRKLLCNNELVPQKPLKKGAAVKLCLQQVIEHLSHFSDSCIEKKQRVTESFFSKTHMQEAFGAVKLNDKATFLTKRFHNLFGVMDILAAEVKEHSSRTLRNNRQGSASSGTERQQQLKRKLANDNEV